MATPLLNLMKPILASIMIVSVAHANSFGKIMCVGDSLTAGGANPPAYRQELFNLLTSGLDTFQFVGPNDWGYFGSVHANIHAGFGGWSSYQLCNGNTLSPSSGKLSDWLSFAPNTVILMCGTNDYWDNYSGIGYWDTVSQNNLWNNMVPRYTALLNQIFASGASLVVFVAPPKYLADNYGPRYEYLHQLSVVVKSVYTTFYQQRKNIKFVDLWSATSDQLGVDLGSDNIHWNNNGAKKAATCIYGGMKRILGMRIETQ